MARDDPPGGELPAVFARMSGLLLTEWVAGPAVARIAQVAKETIPGAEGAGATLIDAQARKTSTASTDALVEEADRLQYELGEGPCLSLGYGGACPGRRYGTGCTVARLEPGRGARRSEVLPQRAAERAR